MTYLVSTRGTLPTGTKIRNRPTIVFDYNDPIDTPLVFNTIDSSPPSSAVASLGAESGRTFLVRWSGQDDAVGSGLESFDVYYSTNGMDWRLWLVGTTATNAYFVGEPGFTYQFYCTASDSVGNVEPAPLAAQAITTVPTNAPVLAGVSNCFVYPYDRLSFTNQIESPPMGSFLFWLGPGAPSGAEVGLTNGVFRWTPNC